MKPVMIGALCDGCNKRTLIPFKDSGASLEQLQNWMCMNIPVCLWMMKEVYCDPCIKELFPEHWEHQRRNEDYDQLAYG